MTITLPKSFYRVTGEILAIVIAGLFFLPIYKTEWIYIGDPKETHSAETASQKISEYLWVREGFNILAHLILLWCAGIACVLMLKRYPPFMKGTPAFMLETAEVADEDELFPED